VEPGQQHPQCAQQTKNQERVVEPNTAPRIDIHQNACSYERVFQNKRPWRYKAITLGLGLWLVAGCVPAPQTAQSVELLGRLVSARGLFMEQPPQSQAACDIVGDVQTRLNYEPGLTTVRPAWMALSDAAEALQAVCGNDTLLDLPALDSAAVATAHQRWQQASDREIGLACDHLRLAAAALERAAPC
jgi:hypothetical protein